MVEKHLENITRYLIQQLKIEVISDVIMTSSSEFADITKTPMIVLRGPDLIENKEPGLSDTNEPVEEVLDPGGPSEEIRSYPNYSLYDVVYELMVISKRKLQMLSIIEDVTRFILKHKLITVDSQIYDIVVTSPFNDSSVPNYSDLQAISGLVAVKAVKIVAKEYEVKVKVEGKEVSMGAK